jgi:hypothetical protein
MKNIKLTLGLGLAVTAVGLFSTTALADEVHTIQSRETLSSILTTKYGNANRLAEIAQLNNIENQDLIYAGEAIILPDNATVTETYTATVETAPVAQEETYVQTEETYVAPETAQEAHVATQATTSSAKEWIAQKESGGSYTAQNGQYTGRYQLSAAYLNGDYSPANQEAVADSYVAGRYGSWENAQAFWIANGWY